MSEDLHITRTRSIILCFLLGLYESGNREMINFKVLEEQVLSDFPSSHRGFSANELFVSDINYLDRMKLIKNNPRTHSLEITPHGVVTARKSPVVSELATS